MGARVSVFALVLYLALGVVGCGGGRSDACAQLASGFGRGVDVRLYWLRDGKVLPVLRRIPREESPVAALRALFAGPTPAERSVLGVTSAIPEGTTLKALTATGRVGRVTIKGVTMSGEVTRVRMSTSLGKDALAQVAFTLGQPWYVRPQPFRSLGLFRTQGRLWSQLSFADEMPPVLLETPLPCQSVQTSMHLRGSSENGFYYKLLDPEGRVLEQGDVSGFGPEFDYSTGVASEEAGTGKLELFDLGELDAGGGFQHGPNELLELPLRIGQ